MEMQFHLPRIEAHSRVGPAFCFLFALGFLTAWPVASQAVPTLEQSFQLQPGWNSVYLEVQPDPKDIELVFDGLPIRSVWTWIGRQTRQKANYISNPSDGFRERLDWLGWFPAGTPEASFTNLYNIRGNRAYLIHVGGTSAVTWTVSGCPSAEQNQWLPNSFNLMGFPLDPEASNLPTFEEFFAPAPAHAGQAVYQMSAGGDWELVEDPASARMKAGEAYWVYSAGSSDYTSPLMINLGASGQLRYSQDLNIKPIEFETLLDGTQEVTVTQRSSTNPVPLSRWSFEANPTRGSGPNRTESWPDLGSGHSLTVEAGKRSFLRLGVRRRELPADEADSVLEIRDGRGSRILIPVTAQKKIPATGRGAGVNEFTGLWIGNIVLNAVNEAQDGGTEPRPTDSEFAMRLLLHVDGSGQVRLLREVTQLWQNGDETANPPTPGSAVLLTLEERFADFTGVDQVDGVPVGRRLSTAFFDYGPDSPGYEAASESMLLSGSMSLTGTLAGQIELSIHHPTNPFRHKFHPDHDNLGPLYTVEQPEAFPVSRSLTLSFSPEDPRASTPEQTRPGWGVEFMGGTYEETIQGIHKNDLFIAGTFELKRVTTDAELNPEVTP